MESDSLAKLDTAMLGKCVWVLGAVWGPFVLIKTSHLAAAMVTFHWIFFP